MRAKPRDEDVPHFDEYACWQKGPKERISDLNQLSFSDFVSTGGDVDLDSFPK